MKQISKKREKGRHKASAHIEVCFLWVCVCLWIHSLPQSPNERPELPPSPSLQSLLHPSCSPPALLSLFITTWTIVCRLLSLSLSQCCSSSSLSLSLEQASCDFSSCCDHFPSLSTLHLFPALQQHTVRDPVFPHVLIRSSFSSAAHFFMPYCPTNIWLTIPPCHSAHLVLLVYRLIIQLSLLFSLSSSLSLHLGVSKVWKNDYST